MFFSNKKLKKQIDEDFVVKEKFDRRYPLKKCRKWSEKENAVYAEFLKENTDTLLKSEGRIPTGFFVSMASRFDKEGRSN